MYPANGYISSCASVYPANGYISSCGYVISRANLNGVRLFVNDRTVREQMFVNATQVSPSVTTYPANGYI